ncbi:DUF29 domain-containing protein [Rhodopila globiformis]|uniref:DUF29 domain-containing protein n=1 Tax=Rhodopila globiformis TaxID=1071 RepID=A0A2S6MV79_RHOGL|nr:DUF29 domain-containing protein [Rhodopila globiformis]PPQ26271.1 hypothetical protein CCS01_30405 [Rhodopila globiformis]
MSNTIYDEDFYAWANEQARLLRAGNLAQADIAHIAEEIESMGRAEKRELVSRLQVLLMHLLKWQFQPERRGVRWTVTIRNQRDALVDHLADNPSLKARFPEAVVRAYRAAWGEAAVETELPEKSFPDVCPWTLAQITDENFWPDRSQP